MLKNIWDTTLVMILGCLGSLHPGMADAVPAPDSSAPTYSKEISRIFQSKCLECHRSGEIGPMSLASYDETRPWVKAIRKEVAAKRMPPWNAEPLPLKYQGDASLSEAEIATILRWADAGAPNGDPKDLPPEKTFPAGWKTGQPDIIFQTPEDFQIEWDGPDVQRCFVMPPAEADTWMKSVEIRPGSPSIVHHIILWLDGEGKESAALDAKDPAPGYPCVGSPQFVATDVLGLWVPGIWPEVLPDGVARAMPKGSRLVAQAHYHSNGRMETGQFQVGIQRAVGPVKKKMNLAVISDLHIDIPPGENQYISRTNWKVPFNIHVYGVYPHMHLVGRSMEVSGLDQSGNPETFVRVNQYDFNWQRRYNFEEPVPVGGGTEVQVKAIYDNSDQNPTNPNKPPKPVRAGYGATDEMNVVWLHFTSDAEDRARDSIAFPRGMSIFSNDPPSSPAPEVAESRHFQISAQLSWILGVGLALALLPGILLVKRFFSKPTPWRASIE